MRRLREEAARARRHVRAARRWARLVLAAKPAVRGAPPRVFFGHDELPAAGAAVTGGTAKFQRLAQRFANSPSGFEVLYLASSWLPRDTRWLLAYAHRRGCPVVLNQNGVAYPGWAGARTEEINRPLRRALHGADHVLYQSAFCKQSADLFLGPVSVPWEILPNAVDTERFRPGGAPDGPPVLLLGGDQTQDYRLALALETFLLVREVHPGARLLVTGRAPAWLEPRLAALGIESNVERVGRYTQEQAPRLFARAHLLLHTKVNDPCPSVVLEALACGLPVVHPASGGTPELVGPAGVGVAHASGYDADRPPTAGAMAAAVEDVLARRESLAALARERAVERFSLEAWLRRHEELFDALAGGR